MNHQRERGGITVLVATLLGLGVLTGSAALVVDVGMIYAEREELQSGADAAAVSIADLCKAGRCGNAADFAVRLNKARGYANANAKDARTEITEVCGKWGSWNKPCSPPTGTLSACVGTPPSDGYVEVRVQTETTTGTTLPPVFARTLAGNSAYEGTTVRACSRVHYCVSFAEATFRHTFNGNAGTATITADKPLCKGEAVTLVSYTSPDDSYELPQFIYAYETKIIGTTTSTYSFDIDVPPCYNQVDFVFRSEPFYWLKAEGDPVDNDNDGDQETFYGPLKVGDTNYPGNRSVGIKAWSHGGSTDCKPKPAMTATAKCDGSVDLVLTNTTGANVDAVFTVKTSTGVRVERVASGSRTVTIPAAQASSISVEDNSFKKHSKIRWTRPAGC